MNSKNPVRIIKKNFNAKMSNIKTNKMRYFKNGAMLNNNFLFPIRCITVVKPTVQWIPYIQENSTANNYF